MTSVSWLEGGAGLAMAGVGVAAVLRGRRAIGGWCAAAGVLWLIGMIWPYAGVAHRLPLTLAVLVGALAVQRLSDRLILAAVVVLVVASMAWSSGWVLVVLGLALSATAASAWRRSGFGRDALPALLYGVVLGVLGLLRSLDAVPTNAAPAGYALAVLGVSVCLAIAVLRAMPLDLIVHLAAAKSAGSLTDRLRVILQDPELTLELADTRPDSSPGTSVSALSRQGEVVAYLRHRQGLHLEPRLVDGLGVIAGLAADAQNLRDRQVAMLADIVAAHEHFTLAHDLESAAMSRRLQTGPLAHLAEAEQKLLGTDLAEHVRRAAQDLSATTAALAVGAVRWTDLTVALTQRAEASPLDVELRLGDLVGVQTEIGRTAVAVCSEALTNAAKHSRADRVTVTAGVRGSVLQLEVSDNGRGGADQDGFGLRGARERVTRAGGRLDIHSEPGNGTSVRVQLPLVGCA